MKYIITISVFFYIAQIEYDTILLGGVNRKHDYKNNLFIKTKHIEL